MTESIDAENERIQKLNANIDLLGSEILSYAGTVDKIIADLKADQTANMGAIVTKEEDQKQLEYQLEENKKKSESLQTELNEKTKEVERQATQIAEQVAEVNKTIELVVLKKDKDFLKIQTDLTTTLADIRKELDHLKGENSEVSKKSAELSLKNSQLEETVKQLNDTEQTTSTEKTGLESNIQILTAEMDALKISLAENQSKLDEAMDTIQNKNSEYNTYSAELVKKLAESKVKNNDNETIINGLTSSQQDMKKLILELSTELDGNAEIIGKIDDLRLANSDILQANEKCRNEIEALQKAIEESITKIAGLKEQVANLTTQLERNNLPKVPGVVPNVVPSTDSLNQMPKIKLIRLNDKNSKNPTIEEFDYNETDEIPIDTADSTWAKGVVNTDKNSENIDVSTDNTVEINGKAVPAFTKKIISGGVVVNSIYYYKYEPPPSNDTSSGGGRSYKLKSQKKRITHKRQKSRKPHKTHKRRKTYKRRNSKTTKQNKYTNYKY